MNTLNFYVFVMPTMWQIGLGIAIVLFALIEIREDLSDYFANLVIVGCAILLFIHMKWYVAAAILGSFVMTLVALRSKLHQRT